MKNIQCPICGTLPGLAGDWKARTHTLWANKSGYQKRLFCDVCGAWHDFKYLNGAKEYKIEMVRPGARVAKS